MLVNLWTILVLFFNPLNFDEYKTQNHNVNLDGIWAFQIEKLVDKFHENCSLLKIQNDTIHELTIDGSEITKYSFKLNQNDELWIKDTIKLAIVKGDKSRLIRLWDPKKYGSDWYVSLAYLVKLNPTELRIKERKVKKLINGYEWNLLNTGAVEARLKILPLTNNKDNVVSDSPEKSIAFINKVENSYMIVYKSEKEGSIDYIAPIKKICKKKFEVAFNSDRSGTIVIFKKE